MTPTNSRHLRRSSPYDPETSRREFREIEARYMADTGPAYALWGPHEFKGTGPQAFFDILEKEAELYLACIRDFLARRVPA